MFKDYLHINYYKYQQYTTPIMPKQSKHLNRRKAGPKYTHKSHKQQKQQRIKNRSQGQQKNKPINKGFSSKNIKPAKSANQKTNKNQSPQEVMRSLMAPKGKGAKQLFKIMPADDDEDQFNAIGAVEQDQQEQAGQQEEFEQGQQEDMEIQEQQDFADEQQDISQEQGQGQQDGQDEEQQDGQDEGLEEQNQGQKDDQGEGEQNDQQVDADMVPLQQQNKQPVDASVINMQIQQTISILLNVQKLGNGLPRKHYVQKLKQYIHQYYGYNFQLIDHFMSMFTPHELIQFLEANQTQRPVTIRTNTLKTRRKELAQALIQRGVNLDPLAEWSKVGIKIYESKVPIGATPQYLAGHYMLQSASSFLPVLALDPQMDQRILDMASAPGGKTTYIAQLMKNTGCIFANDLKKERLRALQFNIYRMGITNTTITCRDGRKYPQLYPNSFDRVLLDAPCTGLGIISKDHSIKANRVLVDIYKNSHVQKQLLLAAIDCTKVNGVIVYSTCSVSPLQNEEVVNFALKKRFVKIVQCDIEIGQEGLGKFAEKRFHPDLKKTRRVYPHVHNMDGFYVAKLVKIGKGKRKTEQKEDNNIETIQQQVGSEQAQPIEKNQIKEKKNVKNEIQSEIKVKKDKNKAEGKAVVNEKKNK